MLAEAVVVQSIVTRLGDGLREIQIIVGGRNFYLLPKSTLALWPTQSTIQGHTRVFNEGRFIWG